MPLAAFIDSATLSMRRLPTRSPLTEPETSTPDTGDFDFMFADAYRPPRPADMADHFAVAPSDDLNSLRCLPAWNIRVPLAEVVHVLSIEEATQPQEINDGQSIVRADIDRNVRHALINLEPGNQGNLLSREISARSSS